MNKFYQIYIENIFKLARSIVLKSDYTAQRINDEQYIKYGDGTFLAHDKTTWKYYRNVAGLYHEKDSVIRLNSFDTHQEIEFTKDNLISLVNTRHEYRVGTNFYDELLSLYPNEETLLLGILNPVDIEKAIEAPEFEIIAYSSEFVEHNEYTLIPELQKFINKHVGRFFNKQFTISDDLYYGTYMSVLNMLMVCFIIMHRKRMRKTSEAHSYHVMQYLNSHSKVGEHYQNMSHDQRMFFMRNIRYIERNNGRKENFELLRETLLDSVGLPLAYFNTAHDLSKMPDEVDPGLYFKKIPINTSQNVDAVDRYEVDSLVDIMDNLAPLNPTTRPLSDIEFRKRAKHALNTSVTVKIMESTALSKDQAEYFSMEDIALYNWAHLANAGLYNAEISVKINSNGSVYSMDAKNAFVFFLYSYAFSRGKKLKTFPKIKLYHVLNLHPQSIDDLVEELSVDGVSRQNIIEAIGDVPVIPEAIASTFTYGELCKSIYTVSNEQIVRAALKPGIHTRAWLTIACERQWCNVVIDNMMDSNYEDWFIARGINLEDLRDDDLETIWKDIFETITGFNIENKSALEGVQKSMIRLLAQLSSYSIRITGRVKSSEVFKVGPTQLRYERGLEHTSRHYLKYEFVDIAYRTISTYGSGGVTYDLTPTMLAIKAFGRACIQKVDPYRIGYSIKSNVSRTRAHVRAPIFTPMAYTAKSYIDRDEDE